MKPVREIETIEVPAPRPDEAYRARGVVFSSLKELLGAADHGKAGDRHAGLAASTEVAREAARAALSELTLRHLHDRPLTDDRGGVDAVMRISYDIDAAGFASIAEWSVGELKNWLLRAPPAEASAVGRSLTAVMAAAVTKLMDVHELVYVARKMARPTTARTELGLPGTLSSRLQPNHPGDDPQGIALLVYTGLSMAAGDALLGVNPAIDTVDNVAAILRQLDALRRQTGVPTQICVLAHMKTQLAALERGAPLEILFQSLAGTERTNLTEFDITIDLLDEGYRTMAARGALAGGAAGPAPQFMYFETGQGSELSYGKHNGIDMTTLEALCYTLARRYDPFMVNNVTGFIGPETHLDDREMILANLQDHFMGKLLGLPMGMAPCYTLHSHVTLEGQQMATQLLTAAGANYYMDVHLNTDRMLAYFDTSAHDDQTLREVHGRAPAPAFAEWAVSREILAPAAGGGYARGRRWGDPTIFCSDVELAELLRATPAMFPFESAGPRPVDRVSREVRGHQARAREAIRSELDDARLAEVTSFRALSTLATSKEQHLGAPDLGAKLATLPPAEPHEVQIVVADGLSAEAVHANIADLYPVLADGLAAAAVSVGTPWLVRYGRVKLAEPLLDALGARLVVLLIGERPGGDAQASRSLSAYLVYRIDDDARAEAASFSGNRDIRFEYSVISNIYERGLPPVEAGSVIAEKALAILRHRAAGNRLESRV